MDLVAALGGAVLARLDSFAQAQISLYDVQEGERFEMFGFVILRENAIMQLCDASQLFLVT